MYLSRLVLNPRSRAVRRDMADCQAMHRTIMSAFPPVPEAEDARAHLAVLHRVDSEPRTGLLTLLVQSLVAPDWSRLEAGYLLREPLESANPACKSLDQHYGNLREGTELRFRIRANPTRKIDTRTGPDGRRRNGKRVELRGEAAQLQWLQRKGEAAGFGLLAVRAAATVPNLHVLPGGKLRGLRQENGASEPSGQRRRLTLASVRFEGVLRITNVESFRRALEDGIGPGKAYGLGLLSVAPSSG